MIHSKPSGKNKSRGLTVVYCGADMPWQALQKYGFRRRNTCLLNAFGEHPDVDRVYVISFTTRSNFLYKLFMQTKNNANEKVIDLFVTSLVPGQRWLPWINRLNRYLIPLYFRLMVGSLNKRKTIVWCYWPDGFTLAERLNIEGIWVFDIDHNLIDDPNSEISKSSVEQFLTKCARTVDLVVSGSRSMLKWFTKKGMQKNAYLRNGVDLRRFEFKQLEPDDIRNIQRPRIGYVGTISRWIDYDLLAQIAMKRPDWSFIVIGATYKVSIPIKLTSLSNVTFLGQRNADTIPAYLAFLDVGLALYRGDQAWLDGDSMKIFEYLAAGLPVVSNLFHEYLGDDFDNLLEIVEGAEGIERAIESVLNRNDFEKQGWNERRREFLEKNTWACRAQEAIDLINSNLNKKM